MNQWITLLFACLITLTTQAQPGKKQLPLNKQLEIARKLITQSGYYDASKYLEDVVKAYPNDLVVLYLLADTYEKSRNYPQAAATYQKVLGINDPSTDLTYPYLRFNLANMLKQAGNYKEAKQLFDWLANNYQSASKDLIRDRSLVQAEGCALAQDLAIPNNIELFALTGNINSRYTDFAPVPSGQGKLYFSSVRTNKEIKETDNNLARIYFSRLINGQWIGASALGGPFNGEGLHAGNASFAKQGRRIYFTRCKEQPDRQVLCRVFVTDKNPLDERWSVPQPIEAINVEGYESSTPYVVPQKDGSEWIFFSSNRPGGKGGKDIWMVKRFADDSFGNAIPIKGQVNTSGDEITPYFNPKKNKLFFSSNSQVGIGGFDIFSADWNNDLYENIQNMGLPYNSPADDMYYIEDESMKNGYIVSNRVGSLALNCATCCDDIYNFRIDKFQPLDAPIEANDTLQGNEQEGIVIRQNPPLLSLNCRAIAKDDLGREINIPMATVLLYETTAEGKLKTLVGKIPFANSKFTALLDPQKYFLINISAEGYQANLLRYNTMDIENYQMRELEIELLKKQ